MLVRIYQNIIVVLFIFQIRLSRSGENKIGMLKVFLLGLEKKGNFQIGQNMYILNILSIFHRIH